jgi:hypothetical protein
MSESENQYKHAIQTLRDAIKKDGVDLDKLRGLLDMCIGLLNENYAERDFCFKWTTYIKQAAQALHIQTQNEDYGNLYWEAMLFEAQNKWVDSYFLYLEKNREYKERFYAPKRKQFIKMGLTQALQGMIDDEYDILCISLVPGAGKALSMDSKVLTPDGFVKNSSLKVGDKVIAANGNVANVIGVYPQGVKELYDVYLDDGSKCRCSKDHLFTVQSRCDRQCETRTGIHKTRTITLEEIVDNLRVENGKRLNYSIDYVKPIEFNEKNLLLHPYVMGALLGDGGLSSGQTRFSTNDKEVLDAMNEFLPKGYELKHISNYDYVVKGHEGNNSKCGSLVSIALKKYGLFGKRSHEKFVPKEYMYASKEQRLWLLRGLLDTDGYCQKTGIEYCTTSRQLSEDVIELVHSLGGYASCRKKKAGYKKDGKYIRCKDAYVIAIQFFADSEPVFNLTRHKEKYKPKRKNVKRFIKRVEYAGKEECQCIMIDDDCHLYITDDYIITHNTTIEKFFNSAVIGWYPKDFTLFYSHSGDITRMYYDGVYDIVTSDEYTWNEIFPDLKITSTNAKMEQFNIGKYKPFPSLQTTSVGSKNAGKVRASKFLLVDDMIGGIEEALNPAVLNKLWDKYSVDARQRKIQDTDGKNCKEIHIATRWSVNDVIGRIIRSYEGNERVKVISVPDIDPVTGESNFDYEYGGFTKEFFADQQLLMDEISYRCLYKQDPVEREGLLFPEDKIRRYLNLPDGEPDIITGQCDTKGKGTDYFVLPCLYKYGEDYYCVDCVCDNTADYELQYENSANLIVHHGMQECDFERNAGGDRVAMEVNKRVEEKGHICNITDTPTETNKEARIYQCSNWILQHVIFKDQSMYTPNEQYGVMMSLLMRYSVSGKKQLDDVPDVFSNFAVRITRKQRRKETIIMSSPI